MKNRGLVALITTLILGLVAAPSFAQEAKKPDEEKAAEHKRQRRLIDSCGGLYTYGTYLKGKFRRKNSRESMLRDGLGLGTICNYSNRSRFTYGLGIEFYSGLFQFTHNEDSLQGSVSVLEMGFKGSLGISVDLHRVKIGLTLGAQQTVSSNANISSMRIKLPGDGGWFDVKDLANQYLTIDGYLQVLEAGLDAEFPLPQWLFIPKNVFVTGGVLLQNYGLNISTKLDDDGRRILEALHYDTSSVERTFNNSSNFVNIHPGLTWCSKKFCTSADVYWGIYRDDKWAWRFMLTERVKL